MKDLIFEIGTEELPAGFIPGTLAELERALSKELSGQRLSFKSISTFGTPRRLAAIVEGLASRQTDTTIEARGPNKKAAYDKDGAPTKALTGFARGQGVDPAELKLVKGDKGEYVYAIKSVKGRPAPEVLAEVLEAVTRGLGFPKSMRWGSHKISFARPVHWIVAVLGTETIGFNFDHIKSGNITYGHRFASAGREIKFKGKAGYIEALRAANVIVDPAERRDIIAAGIVAAAKEVGGAVLVDEDLVEEVVNLVEYPVIIRGSFDSVFLEMPREVVINAMRAHQRYFSVTEGDGRLLPYFITVANIDAIDPDVVRRGNERVLKARLNDARFYYEKDRAKGLRAMVEDLKGVVYQAGLGTSYEKVLRFTELSLFIGDRAGYCDGLEESESPEDFLDESRNPNCFASEPTVHNRHYNKLVLGRAAILCKADLTSGMVGEFPALQGIMGREYALLGEEDAEVAAAIYEHYMPTAAGAELPASASGALLSMADKLDSITGCFGVGKVPTGAQDPYALRRQALGIIAIIRGRGFSLSIEELVRRSAAILGARFKKTAQETAEEVVIFFRERLKNQLLAERLPHDVIEAVLSTEWYDIVDAIKRIRALEGFRAHPSCKSLAVAFKRVSNILKGFDCSGKEVDEALFTCAEEKSLHEASSALAPVIREHCERGEYEKAFEELAGMKETVDTFFDEVMVMVDDEALRTNRLVLLSGLRDLYFRIADISKLVV